MKSAYAIAVLSILGGLLVHLMVLLVIQIEVPVALPPLESAHSVKYIGSLARDAAPSVIEQAALNDSEPLFMPTRWNLANDLAGVASLQSATEIFEPFSERLVLADARPGSPVRDPAGPRVSSVRLPEGSAFILSRFGRKVPVIPDAASEGVSFTVKRMDAPTQPLLVDPRLPIRVRAATPDSLWNPVRLFLHLQGGMPVGPPLVAQSSGFVDLDASLQEYFTKLAFYGQLIDGYYQIWVYP